MAKEWYVIRAISGKEKKVKEYLESEIARMQIGDFISQVLIPTEKVFEMRNGKKKLRERSFLPGYILAECQMTPDLASTIREIPNVIGFLSESKGGPPEPLRDAEERKILGQVDEMNEKGELPEEPFIKGEPVKVMAGPFNGFSGVVDEIYEDKKKVKVVVKIFGRNTPIELNYFQVEKEY